MPRLILISALFLAHEIFAQSQPPQNVEPEKTAKSSCACAACMEAELSGNPEDNVSAFQITLGPGFFLADDGYHTIDGLKLGLLASGGDGVVNGVEAAPFSSSTRTVRGLQTSVCANFARCMEGVQFGLVNLVGEESSFPVQFGIVNHARGEAVQFGIVNLLPDSQFPFIPFFNIN